MTIKPVSDPSFAQYGKVLEGYDFYELQTVLSAQQKPNDAVVYVPSCKALESLSAFGELRDRAFGGMPIQIGYCNGSNTKLNCVEYHRNSEINISFEGAILLVGKQQDIAADGTYDTAKIEAFELPAGGAVELYATTLHYAPCNAKAGQGFHVAIVLPLGTNVGLPQFKAGNDEDKCMTATNKWLIAHPETSEAASGAFAGLVGANIDIANLL